MAPHLTMLAVFYALTSVGELAAALLLFGVASLGAFLPEPVSAILVGVLGTALGIFLLLLALPGLLLAFGLVSRRSWAVPLGWVLGVLNLVNFPIGTLLGLYTFWVLSPAETRRLLGRA
ncbi:MAG TPA: hypothetical protein VMK65_10350 [Longimicrobiales bacterium]|nr:hypothetical protein [Longimicrobiales bacterium]